MWQGGRSPPTPAGTAGRWLGVPPARACPGAGRESEPVRRVLQALPEGAGLPTSPRHSCRSGPLWGYGPCPGPPPRVLRVPPSTQLLTLGWMGMVWPGAGWGSITQHCRGLYPGCTLAAGDRPQSSQCRAMLVARGRVGWGAQHSPVGWCSMVGSRGLSRLPPHSAAQRALLAKSLLPLALTLAPLPGLCVALPPARWGPATQPCSAPCPRAGCSMACQGQPGPAGRLLGCWYGGSPSPVAPRQGGALVGTPALGAQVPPGSWGGFHSSGSTSSSGHKVCAWTSRAARGFASPRGSIFLPG